MNCLCKLTSLGEIRKWENMLWRKLDTGKWKKLGKVSTIKEKQERAISVGEGKGMRTGVKKQSIKQKYLQTMMGNKKKVKGMASKKDIKNNTPKWVKQYSKDSNTGKIVPQLKNENQQK